jgi:hypothetical protein
MDKIGWLLGGAAFLGGAAAGAALHAYWKRGEKPAQEPQIPQLPYLGGAAVGMTQEPGARPFVWPPCPDPTQYRHPSGKCMGWCKGNQVYDKEGNCIPNPCPPYWSYQPDYNICIKGPFAP